MRVEVGAFPRGWPEPGSSHASLIGALRCPSVNPKEVARSAGKSRHESFPD
jgi:hypothetical protein